MKFSLMPAIHHPYPPGLRWRTHHTGVALPTVLALSMLCSVLLLACWRNIALSQGWSRSAIEKWQLRQAALAAISQVANSVKGASTNNLAANYLPTTTAQWNQWQGKLAANSCLQGLCRSLSKTSKVSDWLLRQDTALSMPDQGDIALRCWAEVWPTSDVASQTLTYRFTLLAQSRSRQTQTAWQAVWQAPAFQDLTQAVRRAELQSLLELQP